MNYKEETKDLFTVDKDYVLAHCISADFAMGAGIAVRFRNMGVKTILQETNPKYKFNWTRGETILVNVNDRIICNLVTKRQCFHKPTYIDLYNALISMREILKEKSDFSKKIAMPLIGCGLDGLEWKRVRELIEKVFEETDWEILICKWG